MVAWEQAPPDAALVEDGWHPAEAVREQAQQWTEKWQRPFNPDLSMIDGVLAEVPRPAEHPIAFELTAEALCGADAVHEVQNWGGRRVDAT